MRNKKRSCLIPSLICVQIFLVIFLCVYFFVPILVPHLKTMSLSADTNQTYDINSNVEITLKTDPEDFEIPESAFKVSGGKIKPKNNKIIFTSPKGGNFKIYVKYKDVKSNTITVHFEDKEAIAQAEQERIAQEQAEQARIAQEQAEQARIAQEQAEQARIAQEQAEQARIAQEQSQQPASQERMVWIPATGEKYHSVPDCGRMDKNRASYVSLSEAKSRGYTNCSKCASP